MRISGGVWINIWHCDVWFQRYGGDFPKGFIAAAEVCFISRFQDCQWLAAGI